MTKEELDALENEWKFQSSATAIHIYDLVVMAREALELREALEYSAGDAVSLYRAGGGRYCCVVFNASGEFSKHDVEFYGATPLEAINNARRGM